MAIDTLGANALASDSVTTAKIVDDAVTSAKIPAGAVVASDVADGSISTAKLADDAVTSAKLDTNISIGGTLTSTGKITSTAGITFGSDTAAANVLDDYEEGLWTPAYTSASASFSYSSQYGTYIRVGDFVHLQFYLLASASGTTSNSTTITGLPFAVANINALHQSGAAVWFAGSVDIRPLFNNSQSSITLWKKGVVAVATAAEVNGAYLVGSGTYRAA